MRKSCYLFISIFISLCFILEEIQAQELELGLPISHVGEINDLDFSPDGSLLASSGRDRMIHVFDIETGKRLMGFGPFSESVQFAKFVNDSQIVTVEDSKRIILLDLKNQSVKQILQNEASDIYEAVPWKFFPEHNRMITLETSNDFSSRIKVIDTKDWSVALQIETSYDAFIRCIPVLGADNKQIYLTDLENRVSVYDILEGEKIKEFNLEAGEAKFLRLNPSEGKLAVAVEKKSILVHDLDNGSFLYEIGVDQAEVFSFDWVQSKNELAVHFSDSTIRSYDGNSGKERSKVDYNNEPKFPGIPGRFSADGQWFSVITKDEKVNLLKVETGELRQFGTGEGVLRNSSGIIDTSGVVLLDYGEEGVQIFDAVSAMKTFENTKGLSELCCKDGFVFYDKKINFFTDQLAAFVAQPDEMNDYYSRSTIQIRDLKTGKKIQELYSRTKIPVVRSNANSDYFYRGGYGNSVQRYNLNSGKIEASYKFKDQAQVFQIYEYQNPDRLGLVHSGLDENQLYFSVLDLDKKQLTLTVQKTDSWKKPKRSQNVLALPKSRDTLTLIDIGEGKVIANLQYSFTFELSKDGSFLYLIDPEGAFKIYDSQTGSLVQSYAYFNDPVVNKDLTFYRILSAIGDEVTLRLKAGSALIFNQTSNSFEVTDSPVQGEPSADGTLFYNMSREGLRVFDRISGAEVDYFEVNSNTVKLLESIEGSSEIELSIADDNKNIVGFSGKKDGHIYIFDFESDQLIQQIATGTTMELTFSFGRNNEVLLATALNGNISLYDINRGDKIIEHILFDEDPRKWVHLHSSGLFDASPEAMELMYWTQGTEIIEFAQLKNRYWLPGLWEKVLSGETLPNVNALKRIDLQPEVKVGKIRDFQVPVYIKKRSGGYGPIALFLNGKEVDKDIREKGFDPALDEQTLYISIKDHPYLIDGDNQVEVRASSADEVIQGRGSKGSLKVEKNKAYNPSFFGVVIGVGDYANDQINLKYTINDAEAISRSVKIGADNLFGEDQTFVYTLTSGSSNIPTKSNIETIFKEISSKAKADDIIMVYLSGHGISTSGADGDFYFLTSDALSADASAYADPLIRKQHTVSTEEFVGWLKDIPALKQVMIIDACGSGKAVDNLLFARNVDPSQIKAIDRMKDRTGMFIISGCAADAVSFEASRYGQGLLTYSILQAFKGAALRQDRFVDVMSIMNYARDVVPELASGVGGIQTPQLLIPKGGSFDIGVLEESDKALIPLAKPKQIFVRSTFVEQNEYEDILNLSNKVDRRMDMQSSKGSGGKYIFFDTSKYPEACKLSGGYELTAGEIVLNLRIRCGENVDNQQIKAKNADLLVDSIIELIESLDGN